MRDEKRETRNDSTSQHQSSTRPLAPIHLARNGLAISNARAEQRSVSPSKVRAGRGTDHRFSKSNTTLTLAAQCHFRYSSSSDQRPEASHCTTLRSLRVGQTLDQTSFSLISTWTHGLMNLRAHVYEVKRGTKHRNETEAFFHLSQLMSSLCLFKPRPQSHFILAQRGTQGPASELHLCAVAEAAAVASPFSDYYCLLVVASWGPIAPLDKFPALVGHLCLFF